MKATFLAVVLVLVLAGTAAASTYDFRDAAVFGAALDQHSFTAGVDGNKITITAMPDRAILWWDRTDGFGVQYCYQNDEIEGPERLKISFAVPVYILGVVITDLFNEGGYLERGSYQLNGSGKWIEFTARTDQMPDISNGELKLPLDSSILVSYILFKAPGLMPLKQNHEYSVAAIVTDPPVVTPIPGALWLLGSGLLGLVAIRRKMKK
jgi:hypothetical protein